MIDARPPVEAVENQPVTRRRLFKSAAGAVLAGTILPAVAACAPHSPLDRAVIAGGEPGGFYLEFAGLLAASLQRNGVARTATTISTGGSAENFSRILAGSATMGPVLADSAADLMNATPGRMVAIGKVYENYVHCIVRRDSRIGSFEDLAGRSVGTGAVGSGTALAAGRIIDAAGLGPDSRNPVRQHQLGLNDGLAAIRKGAINALLWSGGLPTAAITAANAEVGLRFLDLAALLPRLASGYGGFYEHAVIPENSYGGTPSVNTIGVANLLLCRADLNAETVRQTVLLLVDHARELIPKSSLGIQFLSPETLINTAGLPLHPAAAETYRTLHG
ncbi:MULTISPECIES: TAXI family TRAP transporter solute-binding subunit [unclassified Arthrobacter]|uniref:TAXI family TRAP transporter solute-binding subunit n=1 Tax=unclassified Arthrobacter TaxID=235627 RepID=UPI00159E6094|nr:MULTISPECIES: TAXI family TRAP transporter solute-binding subunit [unclassified Arthrobacter]MCQ9164905.1 TAXI family TRAP transporter solute-binding subunit [Arthrobacter sp. STN4]NVM98202.1 TAXI family TRAP transporter solute-binding subunit [Arthrobacter sp. SDTb3-6]